MASCVELWKQADDICSMRPSLSGVKRKLFCEPQTVKCVPSPTFTSHHDRIQTIALLLSEPRRKPSLVVAPVVALMQWKHEIEKNAEGFTVRPEPELAVEQ